MRQAKPALALFLLLALPAPAALAQNLVANSEFDTNVSSWFPVPTLPSGTLTWSPLDWAGNPASGSALMTHNVPTTGNAYYASNCIVVPTSGSYELGGLIRIPSGQAATGAVSIAPLIWDQQGCFGIGGFVTFPQLTVTTATTDVWVPVLVQGIPFTAGTHVQVVLRIAKDQATSSLASHFDFVRFGLNGTTPAELLNFEVE